jgi:hypothetical protein
MHCICFPQAQRDDNYIYLILFLCFILCFLKSLLHIPLALNAEAAKPEAARCLRTNVRTSISTAIGWSVGISSDPAVDTIEMTLELVRLVGYSTVCYDDRIQIEKRRCLPSNTRRYLTESIRLVRKFTRTLANDSAEPQNSRGTSVAMHVPHFRSRVLGAFYTHA